jgi:hypothetical protein
MLSFVFIDIPASFPQIAPWGAWLVSRLDKPSDPSPVTLRLVRTPQPDTLSPRERAESTFSFLFIDIPASFHQNV